MSIGVVNLVRDTFNENETLGKIYIEHEFICHTIELPWRDNKQSISCIPEGCYPLKLRYSPIVKRTTKGDYEEGYEITNVPDRIYVMIHVANRASELEACVAPGMKRGKLYGENAVLQSRVAFDKLMERLEERNEWEIVISKHWSDHDKN